MSRFLSSAVPHFVLTLALIVNTRVIPNLSALGWLAKILLMTDNNLYKVGPSFRLALSYV